MADKTETEIKLFAAGEVTRKAESDAQKAVQRAIDARVDELMLESRYYSEIGNARASKASAYKARFVGRTNARVIVNHATDTGLWRRVFGLT